MVPTWSRIALLLTALLPGGCTTTQGLDTAPPSLLLRGAYVTSVVPTGGWVFGQDWNLTLPPRRREFDPAKDDRVVFVMVFNAADPVDFQGQLKSPKGDMYRVFYGSVGSWGAGPTALANFWRHSARTFDTAGMAKDPGLWSLELTVNRAPAGTYRFWLGDPATVARLKRQGGAPGNPLPESVPRIGEDQVAERAGAEAGDGRAMAKLGLMYFAGHGGLRQDHEEAVRWYRKAAEAGDGLAMALLGASYWAGIGGLPSDPAEAVRWYRRGADAGNGRAMALLGNMYLMGGGGLAKDEGEAVRWYRRGSAAGDGRAMAMLGFMYATGGGGLRTDEAEALGWYRGGAAAGDGFAMAELGNMYETAAGGLAKDEVEAARWYRKGAESGNGRAMAWLGNLYAGGRGGLPKDEAEAVRWYRAGADVLDAVAMFELGQAYEQGTGVGRNRREAVKWYRKAASHGFPAATDRLADLEQ